MYRTTSTCRMQAISGGGGGADGTHCPPGAHDFTPTPRDRLTHHPINAYWLHRTVDLERCYTRSPFLPTTACRWEGSKQCTPHSRPGEGACRYWSLRAAAAAADRLNIFVGPLSRLALGSRQRHAARLHTAIPSPCGMDPPHAGCALRAGWLSSLCLAASFRLRLFPPCLDILYTRRSKGPSPRQARGGGGGDYNDGAHAGSEVERAEREREGIPWQVGVSV